MIQIRNVPDEMHRELKARAAQGGMTLSDYLLRELSALSTRPTMKEWLARTERSTRIESDLSPLEAIAAERAREAI